MSDREGKNWNAGDLIKRVSRKATSALGLLVLGLVVLTGLLGGSGPAKAQGTTTLSLAPAPLVLAVDGSGFVDVMVGEFTSAGGLGAYTLAIDFDPSVVTVTSVEEGDSPFAGGVPAEGNPGGGGPITNNIDQANVTGEVRLVAFQASQETGPTGDFRIARINFQAVGGSGDTSDLTVIAEVAGLVDANTGEFVPVTPVNGSVVIGGTSGDVSGTTTLQFRDATGGRALVEIICPSGTISANPADDGTWQLAGVPEETCTITATAPGYLKAEGPLAFDGTPVALPANELLGGDANGDGFVALNDITGMIAQFAKSSVDCEIDGNVYDVNCDGVVALNDITSAITNFTKTTQPFPTQ